MRFVLGSLLIFFFKHLSVYQNDMTSVSLLILRTVFCSINEWFQDARLGFSGCNCVLSTRRGGMSFSALHVVEGRAGSGEHSPHSFPAA